MVIFGRFRAFSNVSERFSNVFWPDYDANDVSIPRLKYWAPPLDVEQGDPLGAEQQCSQRPGFRGTNCIFHNFGRRESRTVYVE